MHGQKNIKFQIQYTVRHYKRKYSCLHLGTSGERKMYSSTLSLTSKLHGRGWSTPRPGHFTPGKENRYPLYSRLGGRQGRSGQVRKISPPPEFDPRTVQPVASRCTDWANPTHLGPSTVRFFGSYSSALHHPVGLTPSTLNVANHNIPAHPTFHTGACSNKRYAWTVTTALTKCHLVHQVTEATFLFFYLS